MKAAVFATIVFATVFHASAQEANWNTIIAKWADERGEVVTSAAQTAALKAFSDAFVANAFTLKIPDDATANIAKAILGAGYVAVMPNEVVVGFGSDDRRSFAFDDAAQSVAVAKALEPNLLFAQLVRLPLITLRIDPVPPDDYIVEINGKRYDAKEKGVYRVDIGDATVRVTRQPPQDCHWEGKLKAGDEQKVDCKF